MNTWSDDLHIPLFEFLTEETEIHRMRERIIVAERNSTEAQARSENVKRDIARLSTSTASVSDKTISCSGIHVTPCLSVSDYFESLGWVEWRTYPQGECRQPAAIHDGEVSSHNTTQELPTLVIDAIIPLSYTHSSHMRSQLQMHHDLHASAVKTMRDRVMTLNSTKTSLQQRSNDLGMLLKDNIHTVFSFTDF